MASNNGINFNLSWSGTNEIRRAIKKMDVMAERVLKEEYSKHALFVEQATKSLAHHDRGDLEDSIHSQPARRTGKGITSEVYVNSDYAIYLHESVPKKYGYRPKYENGSKFPKYYKNGLGLRTRTKPGFRGEKPGRKFLDRAVKLSEKDFDEMNKRAIRRITEGWGR